MKQNPSTGQSMRKGQQFCAEKPQTSRWIEQNKIMYGCRVAKVVRFQNGKIQMPFEDPILHGWYNIGLQFD